MDAAFAGSGKVFQRVPFQCQALSPTGIQTSSGPSTRGSTTVAGGPDGTRFQRVPSQRAMCALRGPVPPDPDPTSQTLSGPEETSRLL